MRFTGIRSLITFWLPCAVAVALWIAMGRATEFNANVEAAAQRGDPEAEFALGQAYDTGQGVPRDPKKAFEYYRRSAEHGHAKAQNNLASLYATGAGGVEKNNAEARKWLRKAAQQGAALAQDNLGLLLTQENDPEALRWFEKAAAQDLLSAQLHLGNLYYNGSAGVEKDYAKAATWLRKAANQNNAWAGNVMGVMYQNGFGVERDLAEATRWFRRAAAEGDAKAQSNIGQMYCVGNGVQADPAEGYKWLALSAEQNEITAIKFLEDFQTGMTAEQIAAGRKRVEEYKQSRPPATSKSKG